MNFEAITGIHNCFLYNFYTHTQISVPDFKNHEWTKNNDYSYVWVWILTNNNANNQQLAIMEDYPWYNLPGPGLVLNGWFYWKINLGILYLFTSRSDEHIMFVIMYIIPGRLIQITIL